MMGVGRFITWSQGGEGGVTGLDGGRQYRGAGHAWKARPAFGIQRSALISCPRCRHFTATGAPANIDLRMHPTPNRSSRSARRVLGLLVAVGLGSLADTAGAQVPEGRGRDAAGAAAVAAGDYLHDAAPRAAA